MKNFNVKFRLASSASDCSLPYSAILSTEVMVFSMTADWRSPHCIIPTMFRHDVSTTPTYPLWEPEIERVA